MTAEVLPASEMAIEAQVQYVDELRQLHDESCYRPASASPEQTILDLSDAAVARCKVMKDAYYDEVDILIHLIHGLPICSVSDC